MAKLKGTALASGLSGSAGPVVFVQTPNGATVVRDKPCPNNPRTPTQEAWRELVRRAGQLWRTLSLEQAEAWRDYAEGLGSRGSGFGTPNASGAFIGLATKVWQVDPLASPPLWPPAQDFTGDGIVMEVSGGAGEVTFTASGPNSEGVTTELLLQKLASPIARPQIGKDRHRAFFPFETGSLEAVVTATPGAYSASVRFVRVATGQVSTLVRIGVVVVGD